MLGRIEVSDVLSGKCVHHSAFAASLALTRRSNECVHFRNWALFGSHVMSALGPEYAGGLNPSTQHFILSERWSVV
jgi:hypothetical protein